MVKNRKQYNQDNTIKEIRTLFESEKEGYYKLARIRNPFGNSYVEYESDGNKNKTLSVKEYLKEIRPYLKDIRNNVKNVMHGKFN